MSAYQIIYDDNRFPIRQRREDGTWGCRGCGGPIPKGRKSWCSRHCVDTYEPSRVRHFVFQRDKGICCECGVDTKKVQRRFPQRTPEGPPQYHRRFWSEGFSYRGDFNQERFARARVIHDKYWLRLVATAAQRRERMIQLGWPTDPTRDWWEAHHRIPWSEGGLTVLENMVSLCLLCHHSETAKWHWEKVEKRKSQLTLV